MRQIFYFLHYSSAGGSETRHGFKKGIEKIPPQKHIRDRTKEWYKNPGERHYRKPIGTSYFPCGFEPKFKQYANG
ncbi:unnamed protein product [marine sediment metagenome]|uniref:Uncharacterized protein n=1 Tax=marine sediment metagenome TaxID=412755 RepID=X1TLK7_9ZZZZ